MWFRILLDLVGSKGGEHNCNGAADTRMGLERV